MTVQLTITQSRPSVLPQNSHATRLWRGLFGSPLNIAITLAFAAVVGFVGVPFVRWAVVDAVWFGPPEVCRTATGACWLFISEKLGYLAFGPYPPAEIWRAEIAFALLVALHGLSLWPRLWGKPLIAIWLGTFAAIIWVLGGGLGLKPVSSEQWGGLTLTILLTDIAMFAAFPIGLALVFGRLSRRGGVRILSIGLIETIRGVPLIAVLYLATLLFPLMLPAGSSIDKLARATGAIALFAGAYLAEVLRSGIEAVPHGQIEAASALGLSWSKIMRLVVLPQAVKVALPSIVTLTIGILLDTTLVVVIGIFELLNAARAAANDPDWLGRFDEAYAFAGLVYFLICLALSRFSRRLERRWSVPRGH
jgi:general L-amino acid transport system permease protein